MPSHASTNRYIQIWWHVTGSVSPLVVAGGRGTPCEPDGTCMGHNGTTVIMLMMILVSSCCPSASSHDHSARSQWHCHSKADRCHLHLQQSISRVQFARTRKRHASTAIRLRSSGPYAMTQRRAASSYRYSGAKRRSSAWLPTYASLKEDSTFCSPNTKFSSH